MALTRITKLFILGLVLALAFSSASWAEGYARPELLITPKSLAGKLKKPDVRILDARKKGDYKKGHIPGAVSLFYNKLVDFTARKKKGYPVFPNVAEEILGAAGIGADTQVIVYDGGEGPPASGLWFVLDFFGHKNVSVLDGGFKRWTKEGWPVSKDKVRVKKAKFIAKPQPKKVVTLGWVKKNMRRKDIMLVDARSLKEYIGEAILSGASRGGHIPGAVRLDWKRLAGDANSYKSADELKKEFAKKGITKDSKVVTYCHQGVGRATDLMLAMKLIGYDNVLIYTGSWQDWSRDPRLPVEK